jgi:hypothetical protein
MARIQDRLEKCAEEKDCCTQAVESQTLVEQLKAERARVSISRKFTARIRELDQAIRLLESSDAEVILRDAQSTLYKEV